MKKILSLFLALGSVTIVWACLNEHRKKNVRLHRAKLPVGSYYNAPDKQNALRFLDGIDLKKISVLDLEDQSDASVSLAYLGRYDEALQLLRRLQREHPEDYSVTANLGTVYELLGKNDSALIFIKQSMKLNHESHEGTEWVHVKILEAKINLARNKNWLQKNHVLNLGISPSSSPNPLLAEAIPHIDYQLKERIQFTPFPDPVLANVFNELGDIYMDSKDGYAAERNLELAWVAYQFSLQYAPADPYKVTEKMKGAKQEFLKKNLTVPDWRNHYVNNPDNSILSTAKELATPENVKQGTEIISNLWDNVSGEKRRREEERKRKIYIGAGIILAIGIGGLVIYNRRKKESA